MSGLKRKEEEIGLVDLDTEQTGEGRKERAAFKKARAQKQRAVRMSLAGMIAGGLALILLGTYVFHISLITVGFVVVIEAVIAAALNNSPFWVHVAIMALQVVMGVFLKQILFLVLAAAYYFLLLVAVKLLEVDG
ncbi:MAG: hypothetical protein K2N87_05260 [Eubacterium sp.]|nr:hypothetical protein [Eubacterium sp.]